MFAKRKRDYRTFIFSLIIITLIFLVIALAWPVPETESERKKPVETVKREPAMSISSEDTGNDDMNVQNQSYYLLKQSGEYISVYFCDGQGDMVELEETEILYDLLGPEDQKLFQAGIRAETQEELSTLLQDYES